MSAQKINNCLLRRQDKFADKLIADRVYSSQWQGYTRHLKVSTCTRPISRWKYTLRQISVSPIQFYREGKSVGETWLSMLIHIGLRVGRQIRQMIDRQLGVLLTIKIATDKQQISEEVRQTLPPLPTPSPLPLATQLFNVLLISAAS